MTKIPQEVIDRMHGELAPMVQAAVIAAHPTFHVPEHMGNQLIEELIKLIEADEWELAVQLAKIIKPQGQTNLLATKDGFNTVWIFRARYEKPAHQQPDPLPTYEAQEAPPEKRAASANLKFILNIFQHVHSIQQTWNPSLIDLVGLFNALSQHHFGVQIPLNSNVVVTFTHVAGGQFHAAIAIPGQPVLLQLNGGVLYAGAAAAAGPAFVPPPPAYGPGYVPPHAAAAAGPAPHPGHYAQHPPVPLSPPHGAVGSGYGSPGGAASQQHMTSPSSLGGSYPGVSPQASASVSAVHPQQAYAYPVPGQGHARMAAQGVPPNPGFPGQLAQSPVAQGHPGGFPPQMGHPVQPHYQGGQVLPGQQPQHAARAALWPQPPAAGAAPAVPANPAPQRYAPPAQLVELHVAPTTSPLEVARERVARAKAANERVRAHKQRTSSEVASTREEAQRKLAEAHAKRAEAEKAERERKEAEDALKAARRALTDATRELEEKEKAAKELAESSQALQEASAAAANAAASALQADELANVDIPAADEELTKAQQALAELQEAALIQELADLEAQEALEAQRKAEEDRKRIEEERRRMEAERLAEQQRRANEAAETKRREERKAALQAMLAAKTASSPHAGSAAVSSPLSANQDAGVALSPGPAPAAAQGSVLVPNHAQPNASVQPAVFHLGEGPAVVHNQVPAAQPMLPGWLAGHQPAVPAVAAQVPAVHVIPGGFAPAPAVQQPGAPVAPADLPHLDVVGAAPPPPPSTGGGCG